MSTGIQEKAEIWQIISREHAWYNMIRVEDWWNRTQVVKQNVSRYNIVMIINRKSDVKPKESNYSKTSDITQFVEQQNKLLYAHGKSNVDSIAKFF